MSSMTMPSFSGRVLAPANPTVQLSAFCTRRKRTELTVKHTSNKLEASSYLALTKQVSRRQGLTIRAAAAAEGQGFASDAGSLRIHCTQCSIEGIMWSSKARYSELSPGFLQTSSHMIIFHAWMVINADGMI